MEAGCGAWLLTPCRHSIHGESFYIYIEREVGEAEACTPHGETRRKGRGRREGFFFKGGYVRTQGGS